MLKLLHLITGTRNVTNMVLKMYFKKQTNIKITVHDPSGLNHIFFLN